METSAESLSARGYIRDIILAAENNGPSVAVWHVPHKDGELLCCCHSLPLNLAAKWGPPLGLGRYLLRNADMVIVSWTSAESDVTDSIFK